MPTHPQWRAVATDLDGTVVRSDGSVSATSVAAARALREAGVPLIAVTARTPPGVRALGEFATLLSVAVGCGGSLGWRLDPGQTLWRDDIAPTTVRAVVRGIEAALPGAGFAGYDGRRWLVTDNYASVRGLVPRGPVVTAAAAEIAARALCAMAVAHPSLTAEQMAAALVDHGFDPAAATLTHASPRLLDIVGAGVDKGAGLVKALARWNVDPSRVIAVGDMPNDLPMLAVAGLGIAVGNAHPEVRRAAGRIVPPVDEDGFAAALGELGVITPAAARKREAAQPN